LYCELLYILVFCVIEIRRMATNREYWTDYSAFRSRDNSREVFIATLIKMRKGNIHVCSVDSCLTLGSGDGYCEVEFIKEFAANITKVIAVERDSESIEHLKRSADKEPAGR